MKITNKHNLPEALVRAVARSTFPKQPGRVSVTEILKSPRQFWLARRHAEEITEDAADRIWALLGSSVHYVLEAAAERNAFTEEKLTVDVNGWTLTGRPDHYDGEEITDYKICSTWTLILGVRQEWGDQLNCYAHLFRHIGFPVDRLRNVLIFRDWMRAKAGQDGYPVSPVAVVQAKLWEPEETEIFIVQRIGWLQNHESTQDDNLPDCSDNDRWFRPGKWAIMKKGRKSAIKLCDTEQEAKALLVSRGGDSIEERPGRNVKCELCECRPFCNQAARLGLNDNQGGDEE